NSYQDRADGVTASRRGRDERPSDVRKLLFTRCLVLRIQPLQQLGGARGEWVIRKRADEIAQHHNCVLLAILLEVQVDDMQSGMRHGRTELYGLMQSTLRLFRIAFAEMQRAQQKFSKS